MIKSLLKAPMHRRRCSIVALGATTLIAAILVLWLLRPPGRTNERAESRDTIQSDVAEYLATAGMAVLDAGRPSSKKPPQANISTKQVVILADLTVSSSARGSDAHHPENAISKIITMTVNRTSVPVVVSHAALHAQSVTTGAASTSVPVASAITEMPVSQPLTDNDEPVVYIGFQDPMTRLGNKMFQYATGLALALRYGRRAILVHPESASARALQDMRRFFRLSPLPALRGPPPSSAIGLVESGWARYDAKRFDSASTFERSVYTIGYFQSWKYFAPVADRVRREFALTSEAQLAADTYFRTIGLSLPSNDNGSDGGEAQLVRIGVHVRRGDMVSVSHLYTVAPAEYVLNAIAHYRAKYAAPRYNVTFIFATDDHAWVSNFVTSRLPNDAVVHYVNLDAGGDMAVLSSCDHSIVTGGTFGWWSAWLAGGDVVYYRDFIRPESSLYAAYDPADYYPPEWLGLTA